MALTASFLEALARRMRVGGLTPAALTEATVDLLPIDGASISSLLGALRLPLGSSSAAARTAEELQTSLGEGPCLEAARTKTVAAADLADLTTSWPLYGEELLRRTPYRSVASLPLRAPDGTVTAAMDLYAEDAHLSRRLDVDAVLAQVVGPLSALLGVCMAAVREVDLEQSPPEWYRVATARRHHVWVATGMLIGRRQQPTRDALSVLRAHAYSLDRMLDDLAGDLVEGRLTLDDLNR